MDLTTFINARLDEDGAAALASDGEGRTLTRSGLVQASRYDGRGMVELVGMGPARVLAQVEAMRKIAAGYTSSDRHSPWGGCGDECEWKALEWALRALAAIWREHPDFDPEWEA